MVSVIIPTCKGSSKVAISVWTTLQQENVDLEIIVVDDNGIGTEEQIFTQGNLQQFIDKKQITYIAHEENRNGSAARNTGFGVSKGEYINFLDDDDILLPGKLIKQVTILEKASNEVGAVICGTNFVHENGYGERVIPSWDSEHMLRDYLCERMKFNTSAILFRRSAIQDIGGFDESFRRHQDWEFCTRMMSRYQFLCCNEVLLNKYAANRNMASNSDIGAQYYNHFREKMRPYFDKLPAEDVKIIDKYHMRRLLTSYILSPNLSKAIKFTQNEKLSCFDWVNVMYKITVIVLRKILFRKKLIALSFDDYRKKAEIAIQIESKANEK